MSVCPATDIVGGTHALTASTYDALLAAALDWKPVSGWTHNFYRYPARFSPRFAAAVIERFSDRGDLVLDPYMGGGTAVVEGVAAGRCAVGNDLNALAAFVATAKTTPLTADEIIAVRHWAAERVPGFNYRLSSRPVDERSDYGKTKNLSLPRARFIKKVVAAALASLEELPTNNAQRFVQCVVLRVSQWALDGRERHTSLRDFRARLTATAEEMLRAIEAYSEHVARSGGRAIILHGDAAQLEHAEVFRSGSPRAQLVVTSPPYPGVHVLYHRWQVDGRRETPAPYWITGCEDGKGASFYNFGDRRQAAADNYFRTSLITLRGIRRVIRDGGYMVQMVAFNRPDEQLERYLANMSMAGFAEVAVGAESRIWRRVPNRKWHAKLRGLTASAKEVVLVHRAI